MSMKLSSRLQALIAFADPCSCLADIGTDHGYVPIRMLEMGKASFAIACDVRRGPLERARKNIEEASLSHRAEIRLGSGLEVLKPGEADEIVIAGMGGLLIREILEQGRAVLETCKKLILSPHTDAAAVREYLYESGFFLTDELMVEEEGKYYVFLKAEKAPAPSFSEAEKAPALSLTEEEKLYGPVLLKKRPVVFMDYLKKEEEKEEQRLSEIQKAVLSGKAAGKTGGALCEKEARLRMLRKILSL